MSLKQIETKRLKNDQTSGFKKIEVAYRLTGDMQAVEQAADKN